MTVATPQTAERILLRDVRWKTYEAILEDPGSRHVHLTYDGGDLEIMSPSKKHEWLGRVIGRLIEGMTLKLGIPIQSVKSTTWKDEIKGKGLEADESYYIQNEPAVRGKADFDPATDPFPDLAIEIEITRSVLDRLAIYAALGIPEIWRYDGQRIGAWVLGSDLTYQESETSRAFPFLRVRDLEPFLGRAHQTDETSLVCEFQAWVWERAGQA